MWEEDEEEEGRIGKRRSLRYLAAAWVRAR